MYDDLFGSIPRAHWRYMNDPSARPSPRGERGQGNAIAGKRPCGNELTLDAGGGLTGKSIDDLVEMGRRQTRGGWKMEEFSPAGASMGASVVGR
jgi:hypothetical protein